MSKQNLQKSDSRMTKEKRKLHYNAICHHIVPSAKGGTDEYDNLLIIHKKYHMMIHNKDPLSDQDYAKGLNKFSKNMLKQLNWIRTEVGNPTLSL